MATRVVEGRRPYTGGKAITVDENRVISLNLRGENNLIIWDEGDNEIYVDLQIPDGRTPIDAFPVGVNTGRVSSEDGWDVTGTIISAETTSGDNIKILYGDDGTLWIDNGTGTFKQIYFKGDVDSLLQDLRTYIDGQLALKQDGVTSDTAPTDPTEGMLWYDTTTSKLKVYDGTQWNEVGTGGAGTGDVVGPSSATDGHLAVFDGVTGKLIKDGGAVPEGVPSGGNNGDVLTNVSGTPTWQAPSGGGSTIEYVTQAEYTALLPGAESDGKHYFIYSKGGWQPGANTLVYLPLEGDVDDYSGNGNNGVWKEGSSAGTPNYATLSTGKVVAKMNGTWGTGSSSNVSITIPSYQTAPKTISVWMYKCTTNESGFNEQNASAWKYFMGQLAGDGQNGWAFRLTGNYSGNPYCWYQCGDWSDSRIFAQHNYIGQWQHLVATCDNTNTYYYINGVLKGGLNKVIQSNADFFMGTAPFEYSSSSPEVRFYGYFSEVILEDIGWTATDITNYYNDTKANYGIS